MMLGASGRWVLCLFLCWGFSFGYTAEHELLKTQDINKIMQQIFSQHVDKKNITASIIRKSFTIYIDQFDPERIYLLASEVHPYLKMSDAEEARILDQYQRSQFPEYLELNTVIQKAIFRARQIRAGYGEQKLAQILQQSQNYVSSGNEAWGDPDLKRPFSANLVELEARIQNSLIKFFTAERKRYGDKYVSEHITQTFRLFEKQARNLENQYLFLNSSSQPMNEAEWQNAFAMHVLKSLANSLDAHTSVLSSSEAYDMRVRLEKEVVGVGLEVQVTKDGTFLVSHLLENSPAATNGMIKNGDVLLSINNIPLQGKSIDQVTEMLQGKKGTVVTLIAKRLQGEDDKPSNYTFTVNLTRDEIAINEDRAKSKFISYDQGVIGIITLDSFYQGDKGVTSENDVRAAIKKLDVQGNLRGLILDLRENSGGFLSQAVKVVGLFITNGVVVISKYFNGEEHVYRDMEAKMDFDGPLIILTSKATASAAEIVAQALQDYGVALIVGDEHTYGKGTIQSQTVTENQASTYFKVTVGTYYTVSGKTPQIQGVKADVVVPSQFVLENIGEEYLDYPLKQDAIAAAYNDQLQDIAPNLKPWYVRYYVPTIQHKKIMWEKALPTLRANSSTRIARNKQFQAFLKGQGKNARGEDDLQLQEAVNIMKDMINIQSQVRHNGGD